MSQKDTNPEENTSVIEDLGSKIKKLENKNKELETKVSKIEKKIDSSKDVIEEKSFDLRILMLFLSLLGLVLTAVYLLNTGE